jgi:hypothetical protein
MNASLTWYRRLLWAAIVAHLGLVTVIFASPDVLGMVFGLERIEFSYVWLGDFAMLLVALSLACAIIASAPARYAALAWLAALEKVMACVLWVVLLAGHDYGASFLPFLILDGLIAAGSVILLARGLPPEGRLTRANLARAMTRLSRPLSSGCLRWFRRVVVLGLVGNAAFILPALFAPALIARVLGAQYVVFSEAWLRAVAVVYLGASLLALPAIADPAGRPAVSWLVVASRFIGALFWIATVSHPGRRPFLLPLVVDGAFGLLLFTLLERGLPVEARVNLASLGALGAAVWSGLILRGRPAALRVAALVALLLVAGAGYVGWYHLARQLPDTSFASDEDQFKHGTIGLSPTVRLPYYLFRVIPEICADQFPDPQKGWASVGLLFEAGNDLPVGFARREIGYPVVEPNCALCHSGSYTNDAGGPAHVLLGAPAHELDLQKFQRVLSSCATDSHFQTDAIMASIQRIAPLGAVEAFFYRYLIVPGARRALAGQAEEYGWQGRRPTQGRGRTDTFNPTKLNVFHLADDGTIGTTDLPAVWNQRKRENLWLHWDGNNNQIRERNYAAAMAIGATPDSVIDQSFQRVTSFLLDLAPPKYPYAIDGGQAAAGRVLFERQCAGCHQFGSRQIGQTTPIEEIATDRHRLDSFSPELVALFHDIDMPPFVFGAYRKTSGYSNLPLDGIWARGPYLHNGSVPTLHDLLQPPAGRPRLFFRGYNHVDQQNVGFVSQGPQAEAVGFRYDVTTEGNGNGGHLYGTNLSEPERRQLVEFMKTL